MAARQNVNEELAGSESFAVPALAANVLQGVLDSMQAGGGESSTLLGRAFTAALQNRPHVSLDDPELIADLIGAILGTETASFDLTEGEARQMHQAIATAILNDPFARSRLTTLLSSIVGAMGDVE